MKYSMMTYVCVQDCMLLDGVYCVRLSVRYFINIMNIYIMYIICLRFPLNI